MLKLDEQLFLEAKGHVQKLDQAIESFHKINESNEKTNGTLPLDSLLLHKEKAIQVVFSVVRKYWGKIDLFTEEMLRSSNIDLNNASEKFNAFFSSPDSKHLIFDYLLVKNTFGFSQLVELVFGKETDILETISPLNKIFVFKVNRKYFVHILLNQKLDFWTMLFAKKIHSVFLQAPLNEIQNPLDIMNIYIRILKSFHTPNKVMIIFNKLFREVDYRNPRSYFLKELHLLNITLHFTSGKRHARKVQRLISEVNKVWGTGNWALTEKEQTLLNYILAIDASKKNDIEKTIACGKFLILEDRLINNAIELLLNYGDVLPNIKPQPNALVKRYNQNYLEQIFYILIDALVKNEQYYDVLRLLKDYEIASCTSIYEFLNAPSFDRDLLIKIEATVQRDIAYIVDQSPQHVSKSIEKWHSEYTNTESPYFLISQMTSNHVTNLLKTFFATEQFELFEQLMEVYTKYLILPKDYEKLRDFVAIFVQN